MKKYLFILMVALAIPAWAKDKKPEKATPPPPKKNPIEEKTKNCRKLDGLFPVYWDTTTGNAWIMVNENHLNKEYIYFSYSENGLVETGHNRGIFRDNRVFTIRKQYDRMEWVNVNHNFYFDPNSALSRSAQANINQGIMASLKIAASDSSKKEYLLDASSLWMSEVIHPIKPNIPPSFAAFFFTLGGMNKDKSKFQNIRNYPDNTDFIVEYVFDNPNPSRNPSSAGDGRYVSITIQHSLIAMPQNDFIPRRDDPRVGYFMTETEDMTSTSPTPYRDVIHRWNLVKKDPSQTLSEPVEPIKWWIEKTTPVEFRPIIKEAALTWNKAFEKAGFKNAVTIEEQPDTATWDAGDIRYNVLRWTSSPNPPFGGYGPSFVNPRTGQILGADIMLEFLFITNRLKQEALFSKVGLEMPELDMENAHAHSCQASAQLQHHVMLGLTALKSGGFTEKDMKEYLRQSLYYLVLHEMGHTLGLNHNMKASQMLSTAQLNDKSLTSKLGLTGSVMDYPAVNVSLDKEKQGLYFTTQPGPYDLWAIEYGYSAGTSDPDQEEKRLQTILARSSDTLLVFGNDADDMRSPGKAIDPRVNINDMGKDALEFSSQRFQLVNQLMGKLKTQYTKPGQSYHEMRLAYLILTSEMGNAANTVSRYIGGVYVDRTFPDGTINPKPFTAVELKDQKKAMELLSKNLFAPQAFTAHSEVFAYLQMQRRGFNFFGAGEDPKIHDRFLNMQRMVLYHLLHPFTTKRLTDSKMYGNKYSVHDMMTDLTTSIFLADATKDVNTMRQNLQIEYVDLLSEISGFQSNMDASPFTHITKAAATAQLQSILNMIKSGEALPVTNETKQHRAYLKIKISKVLDASK